MRDLIKKEGVPGIYVDSAGTAGYHIGKSPDHRMTAELKNRSIAVTGHAQQFTKSHYREFDLIVPMDEDNTHNVLKLATNSEDKKKVMPFMTFCKNFTNREVPDPYYGGEEGFALVADLMEDGCKGILEYIQSSQ